MAAVRVKIDHARCFRVLPARDQAPVQHVGNDAARLLPEGAVEDARRVDHQEFLTLRIEAAEYFGAVLDDHEAAVFVKVGEAVPGSVLAGHLVFVGILGALNVHVPLPRVRHVVPVVIAGIVKT